MNEVYCLRCRETRKQTAVRSLHGEAFAELVCGHTMQIRLVEQLRGYNK